MPALASRRLPLHNNWEIEVELTINGAAIAGGSAVIGFISLTPDGAAVDASVQVNLVRDAIDTRIWRGTILGANIDAHLAAHVNEKLWEIVTGGGTDMRSVRWVWIVPQREV